MSSLVTPGPLSRAAGQCLVVWLGQETCRWLRPYCGRGRLLLPGGQCSGWGWGIIQGVGEQSVECSQATGGGCGQVGWQVLGGPQGACLKGGGG